MRINQKLSLVQPIETDAGRCYVHSAPISREAWESHALMLAKTYAAMLTEGLNIIAGPPMAKMVLREVATAAGRWGAVEQGLLTEIRRLSNLVMPGPNGWETLPFDEAIRRKTIDEDTVDDVEGVLVFFTSASVVLRSPANRAKLMKWMEGLESMWGSQTTSSDIMAFTASLPILTPAAPSPKTTASSIPH